MTDESVPIRRRTFLAIAAAGSAVVAGSSANRSNAHGNADEPIMTIDHVYQITPQYYVGPKRERPPASDAEGTVWEVTTPNPVEATRRTLSDGEQWITLSVEPGGLDSSMRPGEYYLTPADGVEGIQAVIDRTGGNVVIRLAPGQYVGSELTLAHGVVLWGSGPNATTIELAPGANTDLVTTPDPPRNNVMSCTVRDLTFDGNKKNNTAGNVVYGAFWNSRFRNCRFHAAPENGFWLAGSDASTDDNYFDGCRFTNNNGTGLRGGANKESHPAVGVVRVDTNWFGHNGGPAIVARGNSWKITNAKLYHNATRGGASIELDRCSYSAISGCDSYVGRSDRDHVSIRAAKGVTSVGNRVVHNDFRGDYRAAVRCRAEGNDVTALHVRGNTVGTDGSVQSGIIARSTEGGSFDNCSLSDNIFTGTVSGSKAVLSEGWVSRGNVNAD